MTKRSKVAKININGATNARMQFPRGLRQKKLAYEIGVICHNWSFVNAMYRTANPGA